MLANAARFADRESWPHALGLETAALFLEAARDHVRGFVLADSATGLELSCPPREGGKPARAFMKVCSVRPGHTLIFFYKRSLLPFSRDRLGYGGCEWTDDRVGAKHAREALDYLASGLDPVARPSWLRRALPFDVPE